MFRDPFWLTFWIVYMVIVFVDFNVITSAVLARGGKMDFLGFLIVLFLACLWPLSVGLALIKARR